jgi:hypothetical protein
MIHQSIMWCKGGVDGTLCIAVRCLTSSLTLWIARNKCKEECNNCSIPILYNQHTIVTKSIVQGIQLCSSRTACSQCIKEPAEGEDKAIKRMDRLDFAANMHSIKRTVHFHERQMAYHSVKRCINRSTFLNNVN